MVVLGGGQFLMSEVLLYFELGPTPEERLSDGERQILQERQDLLLHIWRLHTPTSRNTAAGSALTTVKRATGAPRS